MWMRKVGPPANDIMSVFVHETCLLGLDMDEMTRRRFNDLYQRFEAGDREEALRGLHDFAGQIDGPWDRAELLYHGTLWLLELGKLRESRLRLEELKRTLPLLDETPQEEDHADIPISLRVMSQYAELKILFAEGNDQEALRILERLLSSFPSRPTIPELEEMFDEIQTLHGLLLANCDRWEEARPYLENASPPEAWRGVVAFYLGQCYYTLHDYERAKCKLVEALSQGLARIWEARAHYLLGIVMYHLSDLNAAKHEFQLCVKVGDSEYLGTTRVWEWLEWASQALPQSADADKCTVQRDNLKDSKIN
jgi:tetratricopeptide (TPR) repeat protein